MTTTENKYKVQLEADRLLTNHFNNENVAHRSPTRRNVPIIDNNFSTYADALVKSWSLTSTNYPLLTSPPISIQRPWSISFFSNRNEDTTPPLLQKRKVNSKSNSLITNAIYESTINPVTLDDTTNIDIEEEVKEILGEMKTEIMSQVDVAIKSQLSSVIKEMKCQIKDMFKKMVK